MNIVFDFSQHCHSGFHIPIINNPFRGAHYVSGRINYFFENEMHCPTGSTESKNVLMMGSMVGVGDAMFSPHTLITNSTPWVVDIEHADWFFMNDYLEIPEEEYIPYWKKNIALRMLRSQWCKKILCRSLHAKESMKKLFADDIISDKCVIFYPAQPLRPLIQHSTKKVTLGIIVSMYATPHRKGGDVAIRVYMELLKNHNNVQLIYVGQLPKKTFFFDPSKLPGLIHHNPMSHEQLMRTILPKIDILLLPSRADSFGTVALEAMSYGKAVVANVGAHVYGMGEIIRNGVNGLTVSLPKDNKPVHACADRVNINEFARKTQILVTNQSFRKKLGYYARELFKHSLSVATMNKILKSSFV